MDNKELTRILELIKKSYLAADASKTSMCFKDSVYVDYVGENLNRFQKETVEGHLFGCLYCMQKVLGILESHKSVDWTEPAPGEIDDACGKYRKYFSATTPRAPKNALSAKGLFSGSEIFIPDPMRGAERVCHVSMKRAGYRYFLGDKGEIRRAKMAGGEKTSPKVFRPKKTACSKKKRHKK